MDNDKTLSIRQTQKMLGVTRLTILRYEKEGILHPIRYYANAHRRYQRIEVEKLLEPKILPE